jgi:molecular chaperone Hsp33
MKNFGDSLQHFLFENTPIRGNIVHLNHTYQQVLQHQTLPLVLKQALGELMAASALLSATLKMEGTMVLQLQSKGALKLLVVECSSTLEMRATAKWDEARLDEITNGTFLNLVKNGQFVITLDPKEGEAYQGIVAIEGETIAEMLQHYMLRSQQIDTSLWLHCDGETASGMLLQKLPEQLELDADAWNRLNILANTITNDELQTLAPKQLPTKFQCSCSKTKVGAMLRMLGVDEVNSILNERDNIEVNCDFCNKQYLFDAVDAAALFTNEIVVNVSASTH